MAHEFSRNIRDAAVKASIALTASDGSVTTPDIDLGAEKYKAENYELEIAIPELTSTHLPSADTITVLVQHGAAASPTTSTGMSFVVTGTGSTIAAQTKRWRLPSDTLRYINVKFTSAGTSGDMALLTATASLLF